MNYSVRYIHKISPSSRDVGPDVELSAEDLVASKRLAEKLRGAGVLMSGARVRSFRAEKSGKIVVFPTLPGSTTYWHSVNLIPKMSRGERTSRRSGAVRTMKKVRARKAIKSKTFKRWQWLSADGRVFYTPTSARRYALRTGLSMSRQPRQR